jgi:hypothetical protein
LVSGVVDDAAAGRAKAAPDQGGNVGTLGGQDCAEAPTLPVTAAKPDQPHDRVWIP